MTRPRKELISLADTPYYHITSQAHPKHFVGQALRRAFLCGVDHYSGQSYERSGLRPYN
jgi:putative transposase